jgi:hypothetical protein
MRTAGLELTLWQYIYSHQLLPRLNVETKNEIPARRFDPVIIHGIAIVRLFVYAMIYPNRNSPA